MHAHKHDKPVEPCLDPPPEAGPGGVDAVETDHTGPGLTPDPPRLVLHDE